MEHIPLSDCVHGGLYRIASRNLSLGIFNKNDSGFIGIREKFSCYYLFTEYHYDTGSPFGTVSPHELLEMYPDLEQVTEYVMRPATEEDVARYFGSRELKVGDDYSVENRKMYDWLVTKHKQYLDEVVPDDKEFADESES